MNISRLLMAIIFIATSNFTNLYCQVESDEPYQNSNSSDTVYPIQLRLNSISLNCFKPDQVKKIYSTYLLYENASNKLANCDSMNLSLVRENQKLWKISENDRLLLDISDTKVKIFANIIEEKDKQLKLKDRERLITELKAKRTNYALEIGVFLAGALLGYTIGRK